MPLDVPDGEVPVVPDVPEVPEPLEEPDPEDDESLEDGELLNGEVEPLTAPLAAVDSADEPDEPADPDEVVPDLPGMVQAEKASAQAIGMIQFFMKAPW